MYALPLQVMVLPRSKLISDLANSSSMPITLHIPETSLDSLNLLIQLLYGVAVEISEDVLPQLRSICKALGLSDWLENDVQKDKPAVEIEEFKEEPVRDDVSKECPPEPLDATVSSVARRSHRVQTLKCELCHNTCYSLASLQRHYNKCHFASASGKRVNGGRVVKTTPGKTRGSRDCGAKIVQSRKKSAARWILSDEAGNQECQGHLKDLNKQGDLTELLKKGKYVEFLCSEGAASENVSEDGGLVQQGCRDVASLVDNEALDSSNIMKAAKDYSHIMKGAEEEEVSDSKSGRSMSTGIKLMERQKRGRRQIKSAKQRNSELSRTASCPRRILDKKVVLDVSELTHTVKMKGNGSKVDTCNEIETGGKEGSTSSSLTSPRLRSSQSKAVSVGESVNEGEKGECFFLLWNNFFNNQVIDL